MDRTGDSSFTAGAGVMVGLRLLEPYFQYKLLRDGYAAQLLQALRVPAQYAISPAVLAVPGFSRFSIGGLNETASAYLAMLGVAGLRHAYWAIFTRNYSFPISAGAGVGIYNGLLNVINTALLVYCTSRTPYQAQQLGWKQYAGIALFALGIGTEIVSEETRKAFKAKPENKGQVDSTGAWAYARHINYTGYTLWRCGVTLATGSVGAAIAQAIFQLSFFIKGSIPDLDSQMANKYQEKWAEYKRKVPYAIIPGVY